MYRVKQERSAFCMHLELQEDILLRMINLMLIKRVKKFTSLHAIQMGIISFYRSSIGLFKMSIQSCQLELIMTRKLTQDCLESLFGCIRQIGSTIDHPYAVSFMYVLKLIMFDREVAIVGEEIKISQNEEPCDSFWLKYQVKHRVNHTYKSVNINLKFAFVSLLFKDMDLNTEAVDDELSVD